MSQVIKLTPASGPGTGTVTSISAATGITLTPDPITTVGTVGLTIPVDVTSGGTGFITATTAYAPIVAGTTPTNPFQVASTGLATAGFVLTSNGAGAVPSFQVASAAGAVMSLTTDDANVVTPTAGTINLAGTHGLNTTGTVGPDTATVAIDNVITLGDLAVLGAGVPAITLTTGDATITAGNINLPTTAAAGVAGVINVNAARFMHSFGGTNTFVGDQTGNFTLTGFSSVGVGAQSLSSVTSGAFNTMVGYLSGTAITSGASNVGVGSAALSAVTTTDENTAIGASALNTITTGANNIAVGYFAGSAYTTNESDNIVIGNLGTITDSAAIRIGTNGTHTSAYVAGIDGVNVGSVAKVLTMASDQLGTATITAGTGITVTPGANTITIDATGGSGFTWTVIAGASEALVAGNGYIANNAGTTVFTLPATAAIGDTFRVTGINNATGWQIAQNAGQTTYFGTSNATTATGTLTSSATRDAVEIICVVVDTDFQVISSVGNITIT